MSLVIAWGWHRHKEPSPCWNLLALACLLSLGIAFRDTPVLTQLNLGVLLLLNVMNPDAMITRINLDRYLAGRQLDQSYLATLSCDAIPPLLEHGNGLTDRDVTDIINAIESRRITLNKQDWRNWNYGRSKWYALRSNTTER
jgi:hypothetical protein